MYLILGVLSMVIQIARSLLMVSGSIKASRKLQRELLNKVVRLPMSFFDSQPTGEGPRVRPPQQHLGVVL